MSKKILIKYFQNERKYCNVLVEQYNQGYLILDLRDFSLSLEKKTDKKEISSKISKFSKQYPKGMILCVVDTKTESLFDNFQMQNIESNFIKIDVGDIDYIGKFIKEMYSCNREAFKNKINNAKEKIITGATMIETQGSGILSHIPQIEKISADFLLQSLGSIHNIANAKESVLSSRTPLKKEEIKALRKFFRSKI